MNIPLNIDWQQILLHLFNFVILATGLTFLLFNPVKKFMRQRQAHFADIEKKCAEREKLADEKAQQFDARIKQADEEINRMKREQEEKLSAYGQQQMAEAKDKAAKLIADAQREAEFQKKRTLAGAQTEIAGLVVAATEKLLSENQGEEHDKALYDQFVAITKKENDEA